MIILPILKNANFIKVKIILVLKVKKKIKNKNIVKN